MPANLVKRAIEQSREREPLVRTMAHLYGARVLTTVDKEAAKQAFAEGAAMAQDLPLDTRCLYLVREEAVRLGTTADPLAACRPVPALALGRTLSGSPLDWHDAGAVIGA